MANHLISIVTPTYNCEGSILDTYNSIKNQSYSNWEWVITDDCSNDNTLEIINNLSTQDSRIKINSLTENSGAAVARNMSLQQCKGDYIAFIDSDDLWLPTKLEQQYSYMLNNNISFSFTSYELIDKDGYKMGKTVDTHLIQPLSYNDMLKKKATLGCSTVMLRRLDFDNLSMPLLRTGQDYALWLKILKSGFKAYPLVEILTQYRILPNSISRNKVKKACRQWQIYRKVEGINPLKSSYYFVFYAWRATFRK